MFTVNIVGKIQSTIKNSIYAFGLLFLHENSLEINKHFVRIRMVKILPQNGKGTCSAKSSWSWCIWKYSLNSDSYLS